MKETEMNGLPGPDSVEGKFPCAIVFPLNGGVTEVFEAQLWLDPKPLQGEVTYLRGSTYNDKAWRLKSEGGSVDGVYPTEEAVITMLCKGVLSRRYVLEVLDSSYPAFVALVDGKVEMVRVNPDSADWRAYVVS